MIGRPGPEGQSGFTSTDHLPDESPKEHLHVARKLSN